MRVVPETPKKLIDQEKDKRGVSRYSKLSLGLRDMFVERRFSTEELMPDVYTTSLDILQQEFAVHGSTAAADVVRKIASKGNEMHRYYETYRRSSLGTHVSSTVDGHGSDFFINRDLLQDLTRDVWEDHSFEAEGLEPEVSETYTYDDVYLGGFVYVMAHETGHALLSQISKSSPKGSDPHNYLVSKHTTARYLQANPGEALSGDWEADVATHEERFAEGVGLMVTNAVLGGLGYDGHDANQILQPYRNHVQSFEHTQESPADFLDASTRPTGRNRTNNSFIEFQRGHLGYSNPLGLDDLNRVVTFTIDNLEGLIDQDARINQLYAHDNNTGDEWEDSVFAQRTKPTQEIVKRMVEARRRAASQRAGEYALRDEPTLDTTPSVAINDY